MRKKVWKILLVVTLLMSMTMTAYAETSYGDPGWTVTFNKDKKMVNNFDNSDLKKSIHELQPGDNVIITLNLKNENDTATDWYMANAVIKSLEDTTKKENLASGGAYTYRLIYTAPDGTEKSLYDSDTVGGEDETGTVEEEGLRQATNALEDWLFLGTLSKGQVGKITLEVALDGDTQGNDYQNTLAELQMNFAVELNTTGTNTQNPNPGSRGDIVKTGDEMTLTPFIIVACVTGFLLLLLAMYGQMEREKEKKRGGAVRDENI